MYEARLFSVVPSIPEGLAPFRELIYNLWWTWNPNAVDLIRRLDRALWEEVEHNPLALLARISQEKLTQAAEDSAFQAHLERVLKSLETYSKQPTWLDLNHPDHKEDVVAYFSAEYGIHECLPLYSGGLGTLAGDHLKSSSDMGIPLVAIGLAYRQGYLHQHLTKDGWQFEDYPDINFPLRPMRLATDEGGDPIKIAIPIADRTVQAQVWRVQVGRVPLFLLDTSLPENGPKDHEITSRLYGGDQEMRIRQEIVLGIGGVRALQALKISPMAFHINEGHSAFMVLERIRRFIEDGLSMDQAKEAVAAGNVFTTHTPVPAGIDTFPASLVERYLGTYAESMGLTRDELLSLGREEGVSTPGAFSMAILALNLSRHANAVSDIHGHVSRNMWQRVWKNVPQDEVPITSITNGIHTCSWLSLDMSRLFDRYLGPEWAHDPSDAAAWERISEIPDTELWKTHERERERLVVETRQWLRAQLVNHAAPPAEVEEADRCLSPSTLTIGFARRFAPYKRATLFLREPERLIRLLTDKERPVQFIIAGKAHPRDNTGKELIKKLVEFCRQEEVRHHVVFLEDYQMGIARRLVTGVDVWMNTPMKHLEASGTSGMKIPANGGINMSILDGWWCEGYDGTNGWVIGDDRVYNNDDYQNFVESESIYELLEQEIIPMFYDRGGDGLPNRWIAMMKASMQTLCPRFNTHRMVREYVENLYLPAVQATRRLIADNMQPAKALADWKATLRESWPNVHVESVESDLNREHVVGSDMPVTTRIHLGTISPDDVAVELYHGPVNAQGEIAGGRAEPMHCAQQNGDGRYTYQGQIPCDASGQHGYAVRVVPKHTNLVGRYDLGLIKWG